MGDILVLTETDEGRRVYSVLTAVASRPGAWVYGSDEAEAIAWRPWGLVIVCGWRRLLPRRLLDMPTRGVVGFHSAKLPEYPGRAPVPWTLVRGDKEAVTTLFYLDEGVDSGDIIDSRSVPVEPGDTVESIYAKLAEADIDLLRQHLPAIMAGTAPRTPQDPAKRGPLTTKEGWALYHERQRMAAGHA